MSNIYLLITSSINVVMCSSSIKWNFLALWSHFILKDSQELLSYMGNASPRTLQIINAVQNKAVGLIDDTAFSSNLLPVDHRQAVVCLSSFFCFQKLSFINLPLAATGRLSTLSRMSSDYGIISQTTVAESRVGFRRS